MRDSERTGRPPRPGLNLTNGCELLNKRFRNYDTLTDRRPAGRLDHSAAVGSPAEAKV